MSTAMTSTVKTYEFEFGGESLIAAGDRTLYWPAGKTLFATDLHAGKATHMRLQGVAIPDGNLSADLSILTAAIARTAAEKLLFLGDLFHSEVNREWNVFVEWCRRQNCVIELVRGNHDRFLSDAQLQAAGIAVHSEPYRLGPFALRHHPSENSLDEDFIICGHVHPVQHVFGAGGDHMRLPCFWQRTNQLVLPAFGSFTGGHDISRAPHTRIICCAPDRQGIVVKPTRINER